MNFEQINDNKINNKNIWAIIGIGCALSNINILGLIASILGMKETKNNNKNYYFIAVTGLIISIIHILKIIALLYFNYIIKIIEGTIAFNFNDFISFLLSII